MFPNLSQAPGITQRNPVRNVPIPLPNNQSIPLGVQNRGPAFHGLTGKFSQSKPISSFISSPLNRGAPSVLSSPSSSLLSNAPVSSSPLMDRNSTPGKNHPSYKTQFTSIQDIQQRLDFYINLDQPIVPPSEPKEELEIKIKQSLNRVSQYNTTTDEFCKKDFFQSSAEQLLIDKLVSGDEKAYLNKQQRRV